MQNKIQLFNDKAVRTVWDASAEEWFFSVVDIIAVLTDSDYQGARNYWKVLKNRLTKEGSELVTLCNRLKLPAEDGKMRMTDVLGTKGVLRLVQSIPSSKAEPFKVWLAQVGAERLDEIADPEKAFTRGVEYYRQKGYPEEWITQRMLSIKIRKELTAEWQERGVGTDREYAILTNEMTQAWSGMTVQEYKKLKGIKKEGLRDNMTDMELVLNMLAEVTTTALSRQSRPQGFDESRMVARRGGAVAGDARKRVESELGETVISPLSAAEKEKLETGNIGTLPTVGDKIDDK